jgi:hypothetical protein
MEKVMYALWGSDGEEARRFLVEERRGDLLAAGARGLNVADSLVPCRAPVPTPPDEEAVVATLSVWLPCYQRREAIDAILAERFPRHAAFLVCESLYTDYGGNEHSSARDWPDGQRSPGVSIVTFLVRPERIDHAAWIAHWHETQSPVSEAMQPRTRYVRNEIVRPLTPSAPPWSGIVEECWPSADHVMDPHLFYGTGGDAGRLGENMSTMMESVCAFLDLETIRTVAMSEYLLATDWSDQ